MGPAGWAAPPPPGPSKPPSHYNDYLNAQGYPGHDPWEHWANAVETPKGEEASGWLMENGGRPARVKAEHSESAYSAARARDVIEDAGDDRWCVHLSFIKPHWPYIAPAPYHALYSADDILPPVRNEAERTDLHPVLAAFQSHRVSRVFSRDSAREAVIPENMGLITQIDDEIGRMVAWLAETGRDKDTGIVFTLDHGDYLGDHWLGEKELLHTDPQEQDDRGADPAMAPVIARLEDQLLTWALAHHNRVTRSDAAIESYAGAEFGAGILIGFWDQADFDAAVVEGHGGY